MTKNIKIEDWILDYKNKLKSAFLDNAWDYFDHEDLKVHPIWNGYHCSQCNSLNSLKNKEGLCVKCLVLKEKIDVLDKILNKMKGGSSNNGN